MDDRPNLEISCVFKFFWCCVDRTQNDPFLLLPRAIQNACLLNAGETVNFAGFPRIVDFPEAEPWKHRALKETKLTRFSSD